MLIRSIDVLKGGEVLAEPIISQDINIPRGTVIKTEYIPLIKSMGIEAIMVEDPYERFETPTPIIETSRFEDYVGRTRRIMENHIYHSNNSLREFETIANEIVKDVQDIPDDRIIDITERAANLYEHTVMVTLLSVLIGKRLQFDKKRLYNLALGSLLHDIGIRYITVTYESVDVKTMDPVAVFELKKHTILGYSALDGESWIPDIARKMILSHHERIDGTGYPMRQKNKELECRIIQVCDTFDCLISGMECKRVSLQETVQTLQEQSDKAFDGKVVDELLSMIAKYPVGTILERAKGKFEVVTKQTVDREQPVTMVIKEIISA